MKTKLTLTLIQNTPAPESGRITIIDSASNGLCVRISAPDDAGNVARVFYVTKWANGRQNWVKIGPVQITHNDGGITVDDARKRVKAILTELSAGNNPNATKRAAREAATLGDMWEAYRRRVTKRERTMAEDAGLWGRYLEPWARRRLSDVTPEGVEKLYGTIAAGKLERKATDSKGRERPIKGGATAANRMLALLSGMFTDCARVFGMAGYNPCREVKRGAEQACERYLTAEEMAPYWHAVEAEPAVIRDLIKLAILTAQRRTPLLAMKWADVNFNFKTWTIPAEDMKSGKAHPVPLVPQAIEILKARRAADPEGVYVFPAEQGKSGHLTEPKKGIVRVYKRAGVAPVTLHDLRRTTATWMNSTGASEATIASLLAHKHKNVTGIYAKATADAVRTALDKAVDAIKLHTETTNPTQAVSVAA